MRPNCDAFRQIHPAHDPITIDQEFARPRNVRSFRAAFFMQEIVSTNNRRVRIGQQRKGEPHLLAVRFVDVGRINTDGHDTNATPVELSQIFLKTPQLGVAQWSPMSAIENQ